MGGGMSQTRELAFAVVSMEGPDEYSQAGGLGVRVAHLSSALAAAGYPTWLYFVGDPGRPATEVRDGVTLRRVAQEVSRQHPRGVYDGEGLKAAHLAATFPSELVLNFALPQLREERTPVVLFEEWHTAPLVRRVSDFLWQEGARDRSLLVWNANNQFGFEAIDWAALAYTSSVTTVSRYMRVLLQARGVDPLVIPNGIPLSALRRPPAAAVQRLRRGAGERQFVLKIGRFHPDKRWAQAISALGELRRRGVPVRMLARGGGESYGRELMRSAEGLGLRVATWRAPIHSASDLAAAMEASSEADILELATFLPESLLPVLYVAAQAVLANSGFEPFGLVGLETMAAGGVAVVGATGEDYARHRHNCLVAQTDEAFELAGIVESLVAEPALERSIRRAGRATARTYTWPEVVAGDLVPRLPLLAARQMVRWPSLPKG